MRHTRLYRIALLSGVVASAVVSGAVLDAASFAKKSEIQLAGASGSVAVADVPVAVRISPTLKGFTYNHVAANGADIRFADAAGNLLAHEVAVWNPAGESLIWVKVPSIPTAGTTITMYYQAAEGAELPAVAAADVWTNYRGVWHLDDTGTSVADAAGKVAAGTVPDTSVTKVAQEGVYGTSVLISNSDNKSDTAGGVKIPSFDQGTVFTVSVWLKHRLAEYNYDHLLYRKTARDQNNGWGVELDSTGVQFRITGGKGGESDVVSVGTKGNFAEWTHVAFAFNGSSVAVYRDGVKIGTGTTAPATDNGKVFALGQDSDVGGSTGLDVAWHGWMDEVRMSMGGESDGAIQTEYRAMAPDSGFATMGACQPIGAAPIVVSFDSAVLADGAQSITVAGEVKEFGLAESLTLKLLWGETEALEGAPVELGTWTAFGAVKGSLPCTGFQEGKTYYLAIQATGDDGVVAVTETKSMPYYTGLTWAGAAGDVWSSTAWLTAISADPVAFTFGQYARLDDTAAQKTVVIDQATTAAGVTIDTEEGYILDGTAKLTPGELVKTGSGPLVIAGEGLTDGSQVTVKGGVLKVDATSPTVGKTPLGIDSVVTVEPGAAFDINTAGTYEQKPEGNDRTRSAIHRIAGAGPNGEGAIINSGSGWNAALSRVELLDDATIGGPGRVDVRPNVGTAVEGYIRGLEKTLTIINRNSLNIVSGDVIELGAIVVDKGGIFSVEDEAITWDVPGGITLKGEGRLLYRYNRVPLPVTIPDGETGIYEANSATGNQDGPTTVGAGATLKLAGNGSTLFINGPVVNNGEIQTVGNGPYLNGEMSGDGLVQAAGAYIRMAGGLRAGTLRLGLTGGIDLGCPAAAGYPQVANPVDAEGAPLTAKGAIYLRARGGAIGESWNSFFSSTKAGGHTVYSYNETANVTTCLDHVTWELCALRQAQGTGESHIRLVNGSKVTVTNDVVMGYANGPRSASLYLEGGTEMSVLGSGNDALALGQWSGPSNGVYQVTVDGARLEVPNAIIRVGKDGPYGYFTAKNGAVVRAKGIGSRVSFGDGYGATNYTNGDECVTLQSGATMELGEGGLRGAIARPDLPNFDFEDGTLRALADWTYPGDWPQIAFGSDGARAGRVVFDLNGKNVGLKAAIGGASEVELKGPGTFTTYTDIQSQPIGKWTVDSDVTADFSGFTGFAGGLELGEGVSAKMNLNVQDGAEEGLVEFGLFPKSTLTRPKGHLGPLSMRLDNMALLHSSRGEGQKMQNVGLLWRGQFHVAEEETGTWHFGGTFDDNIYFEIDGEEVLTSTSWNGVATGARELDAGWHDFRVAAADGTGGQGPAAANGWSGAMGLGWTRFAPADDDAAKRASTYTKFDPSTLRMRPSRDAFTGARWMRGHGPLNEGTWEKYEDPLLESYTNIYAALDAITNGIRCINSKAWSDGPSHCARFLGYFKVEDAQAGDWSFKGQYDDRIALRIDGRKVLSTTSWDAAATGTVALDAGWHAFDIRVGDGTGGWGAQLKDADGNDAALVATTPGGRATAFDERAFKIAASIFDIAHAAGAGLGGDILLNAGSTLENLGTRGYCPIGGRLLGRGAGTLKGRFRMVGGTLVVPGPGPRVGLETRFANADAQFLAGLGAIELDLAGKPTFSTATICDAYGLTAADAAKIPVTATIAGADDATVEKYADAFSATVKDGKLVVLNARGGGCVIYLR